MIHSIEIKANVEGGVADALSVLGLDATPSIKRQIWFAERRSDSDAEAPLLSAGVIVRFRSGEGPDDSTVKLRPCTESALVDRWSDPFGTDGFKYRIEGDWSGQRRVLSASAVTSFGQGVLAASIGAGDTAAAISDLQRDFVRTCGARAGSIDGLTVLGPIASTKFEEVKLNGLEVNAERWTVLDLDFLELSIRVKARDGERAHAFEARAEKRQAKLEAAIDKQGLKIAHNAENKTQRVLAALAAAQDTGPHGGR
jgi:hypothetical protein